MEIKLNKFLITKNYAGKYTWTLLAANGQPIANGLRYASLAACYNAIESVKSFAHSTIEDASKD